MNEFFIYTGKAAVYLMVFHLFYRGLLAHDTAYRRNRIFLLLSLLCSVTLPLLTIRTEKPLDIQSINEVFIIAAGGTAVSSSGDRTVLQWIYVVYLSGVIVAAAIFLFNIGRLLVLIARYRVKNSRIISLRSGITMAYSAFGFIFLNKNLSDEHAREVIRHEMNHIRSHHFLDVLFSECIAILQWFNPFIYLLKKELRGIHEFEADRSCLDQGADQAYYQQMLMSLVFNTRLALFPNHFSGPSQIKKRILMMKKNRSNGWVNLKLIMVIPVIMLVMLAFSACKESDRKEAAAPVSDETSAAQVTEIPDSIPSDVYMVADEMPRFPGGDEALMKFINDRVRYPEEAKKNGVQGKVIVRFCVKDDGSVGYVSVLKQADPQLDAEAMRVVRMMPRWTPGKQDGKPVNVWYIVPITFQLN